jgi:hypothetical protein
MDNLYLQTHLKLLLTEFAKAYVKGNFIEFQQIREKINHTKELMNNIDISKVKLLSLEILKNE